MLKSLYSFISLNLCLLVLNASDLLLDEDVFTEIFTESFETSIVDSDTGLGELDTSKWYPWGLDADASIRMLEDGQFSEIPEGVQFLKLEGHSSVTTENPLSVLEAGEYEFIVSLGNPLVGSVPGVYKVMLGYGKGAEDFHQLESKSVHSYFQLNRGHWTDASIRFVVNEVSPAIGRGLLIRIQHYPFDNGQTTGYIDNIRVFHRQLPGPVLEVYDWPTEDGEASLSDKYRITMLHGDELVEVETLMSHSLDRENQIEEFGNSLPSPLWDRTFSWLSFSANFVKPITLTIEKLYGEGATGVEVYPSDYAIPQKLSEDGRILSVTLTESRYFSVNFLSEDNRHTGSGAVSNMLMIFADPLESDTMDRYEPGVHVFSWSSSQLDIDAASKVFVPAGYYNAKEILGSRFLYMSDHQSIYFEGGAYFMGLIHSHDGEREHKKVYGRGAVCASEYPRNKGDAALIELPGTDNEIKGILAFDSTHHGVVPGWNCHLEHVKFWGWHYNSDGFRPWGNSLVQKCFLRPVDDAFYVTPSSMMVTDTVVWMGCNGGVVTYGWGDYGAKHFRMNDSYIMNCEWRNLGNNNGVIMSQMPATQDMSDVHFENILIDGNIVALTNLKLGSRQSSNDVTGIKSIHDLSFRNVRVNGTVTGWDWKFENPVVTRSLIEGAKMNHNTEMFWVQDVDFVDLMIDGNWIDGRVADQYFDIDPDTTRNIRFRIADRDQDTMPDVIERLLTGGKSSVRLDPFADDDLDGLSNFDEFKKGTDIYDSESRFFVFSLEDSMPILQFPSSLGRKYRIERRYEGEISTPWEAIHYLDGNGTILTYSDESVDYAQDTIVYRVLVQ